MNPLSPKALMPRVQNILHQAEGDPKRLTLLHTLIALGAAALVTLVSFLLDRQIENAVGISGMEMRTALQTAQTVLRIVLTLLSPLWEAGMLFLGLRLVRDGEVVSRDLGEGLRRFGAMIRLLVLELILLFAVGIITAYISSAIFMATPFSMAFSQAFAPLVEGMNAMNDTLVIDEAMLQSLLPTMRPMLVIWAAAFAALGLPVWYRLRMTRRQLLSDEQHGAFAALMVSLRTMKGRRLSLLRLDLHFWWYYLLQLLLIGVCNGDVVLGLLHIQTPLSQDGMFFLCYFLYLAGRLLLLWQMRAQVETANALFWETAKSTPIVKKQPDPSTFPWDYNETK